MLSSSSMIEPQGIVSLSQYIQEQAPEKPYRFVVIYNDPSNVGDDSKEETDPLADKMLSFGKELGLTGFKAKIEEAMCNAKQRTLQSSQACGARQGSEATQSKAK